MVGGVGSGRGEFTRVSSMSGGTCNGACTGLGVLGADRWIGGTSDGRVRCRDRREDWSDWGVRAAVDDVPCMAGRFLSEGPA